MQAGSGVLERGRDVVELAADQPRAFFVFAGDVGFRVGRRMRRRASSVGSSIRKYSGSGPRLDFRRGFATIRV